MVKLYICIVNKTKINTMHTSDIKKDFFLKGFFYWFGIEDNPFQNKVEDTISTTPNNAIKNDLHKVKSNYRKSIKQLKKEAYNIG